MTASLNTEMAAQREEMVREIERSMASLGRDFEHRHLSPRVLRALREVPRHLFVPPEHIAEAYRNRPVPIGYGQTISQPFIVALMTELLDLKPDDKVLDVGTGSGYQAAILARLVRQVVSIERCEPLAERARRTFQDLGITNIRTLVGDGHLGVPEEAPFDAIVVAAAPAEIPEALTRQLAPKGRLVLPVGSRTQELIVVEKQPDQSTILREIIPVCFVPLTRDDGGPV